MIAKAPLKVFNQGPKAPQSCIVHMRMASVTRQGNEGDWSKEKDNCCREGKVVSELRVDTLRR